MEEMSDDCIPPYPVSASAIKGTEASMPAIMDALSRMSFMVAMPMSAMPRRDIVVPAPVCLFGQYAVPVRVIRPSSLTRTTRLGKGKVIKQW